MYIISFSQDVKDHLREAGDVYYAEVYGDGTGIVEFARQKDADYATKNLDNTKFKSHEVRRSVCNVDDMIFKFVFQSLDQISNYHKLLLM